MVQEVGLPNYIFISLLVGLVFVPVVLAILMLFFFTL